ncbi:Protein of unknown function [Pyronema omphalodes CBS 100304]|uniref:Uncharacterized protein n=1 Tax=Pyronema omphalodes (strain CBS 100304) TaxID=1076935 RepID=U4L574_PYROM|nr:Protein of unknown function [Pyronema omphalodes CBS 100304]
MILVKSSCGAPHHSRIFLNQCYASQLAKALDFYWDQRFPKLDFGAQVSFISGVVSDGETLILYRPTDTINLCRKYVLTDRQDIIDFILLLSRDIVQMEINA